jgi:hypothetical protein
MMILNTIDNCFPKSLISLAYFGAPWGLDEDFDGDMLLDSCDGDLELLECLLYSYSDT